LAFGGCQICQVTAKWGGLTALEHPAMLITLKVNLLFYIEKSKSIIYKSAKNDKKDWYSESWRLLKVIISLGVVLTINLMVST
jgi:hypothetical protein